MPPTMGKPSENPSPSARLLSLPNEAPLPTLETLELWNMPDNPAPNFLVVSLDLLQGCLDADGKLCIYIPGVDITTQTDICETVILGVKIYPWADQVEQVASADLTGGHDVTNSLT